MIWLLLLFATSALADEKFISSVNWKSEDGRPPEPCVRTVLMWQLSDDGRTLSYVSMPDGEVTQLKLIGSSPGATTYGVRFYGRISSQVEMHVTLIGSPLPRVSKIEYAATFKRPSGLTMYYGNATSQMERCFWRCK